MLVLALVGAALLSALTLVHVYRGGTTLNDHVVAAIVTGTHGVYPLLAWGAHAADAPGHRGVAAAALCGNVAVWGLFFVLDRRVEVGRLRPLALASQPAHAFALWTGLLLCFWMPAALVSRALDLATLPVLWPGPLLFGPLALAAAGSLWTALRSNRLRTLRLPGSRPLRIVHLSDLHASPVMPGPDLRALVERTNALRPDLVCITGDLLMPFSEQTHDYLLDALARLEAPAIAVPGNHDLPVAATLGAELGDLGIHWLVDDRVVLDIAGQRVEVVGLDFRWTGAGPHLDAVLDRLPPADAHTRVLAVHDPRYFRFVPADRFDLVLSGHTHGGQLGLDLPFLRVSALGLLGAYDGDLFERGGTRLYVHRGNWHTGWPPRMGIAGEVALLELGPEAQATP